MESLQNWELLGKNCINSGLYWGSEAGNYYVNLGREGSRRAGAGLRFAEEWAAEEILDQVGSRLAAGRGLLDIKICMPTRQGIVCGRLSAARSLLQRHNLYGSPPGRSFYSCASSRALLHVGSLSLWDRQPSNAPPLLLSPAGLATRRGPHSKTRLGLRPKTPLPLNCGWIRTMPRHRPYGAADTLSRCLRRILCWETANR